MSKLPTMGGYEDPEKKYGDETNATVGPATNGVHDPEKNGYPRGGHIVVDGEINAGEGAVQRSLKQRHMAMIALGGAIGTGLFVGSGGALAAGGPVGVWLGYILMASMVFAMMVALGEMAALYPLSGGFVHYAARFVDPALGFATGYNYWYSWAITLPTEVVAASIVISYWDTYTPAAVWITVCLVLIWFINFWGARAYGEAEFWFSSLKVVTAVGLIILGIVLMAGGGPNHDVLGFRYWADPGPFNQIGIVNPDGSSGYIPGAWGRFLAFWSVFVQAAFSFIGTEIIATTLGEAQNPRKTVPKAIKRVFFRLLIFYVGGIFVISTTVPYTDPNLLAPAGQGGGTAAASPFVIAIVNAGIPALPSIVNAVILISAWSAGNSDLYAASRTLYALALEGQTPRIFKKCTKKGLPIYCVLITAVFGPLAYMNTGGEAAINAFNWLYNISAIAGILAWWAILLSYIRFYHGLKRQGLSRADFPYKAPLQPYLSYYGFISFTIIMLVNGFQVFLEGNWSANTFVAAYVTIPIFAVFYVGWKIAKRTRIIPLDEIDFVTGRRELDEMEARDNEMYKAETWWQKVMSILF